MTRRRQRHIEGNPCVKNYQLAGGPEEKNAFCKKLLCKKPHGGVGEKIHWVKKSQVWRLQVGGGEAEAYIVENPSVKKLPVGGGPEERVLSVKKLLVKKRTCKKKYRGRRNYQLAGGAGEKKRIL